MNNDTTTTNQRGATAIEYTILCALVAIIGIAALDFLGPIVVSEFKSLNDHIVEQPDGGTGPGPTRRPPAPTPPTMDGPGPTPEPTPKEAPKGMTPTFRLGTWSDQVKRTPTYPVDIEPGDYQITFLAWDGYPGREDQPEESADVYVVFEDGTTQRVTTTPDVGPGEYAEKLFTVDLSTDQRVVGMYGQTSDQAVADGGPNSVNLELLAIDPQGVGRT